MEKINPIKLGLKMCVLVLFAAILGMILLWLVYLLPVEPMAENVAASAGTLKTQDDSEDLLAERYWKAYDRGTNIIMLHEIILPSSGDALQDALLCPTANYLDYWTQDWADVLNKYATDRAYSEEDYVTYARYWHGYLIFLKPLFLFMNLLDIYVLNTVILTILTIVIAYLFKKKIGNYWFAYLVTILMMDPVNIAQSFQLSTVFYALQITLFLLLVKDKWKKEQVFLLFVFDGILVAFLDFLTYPYVALGIPLLTYYLLNKENDLKDNVITAVVNGISFVVGYAGMWGMKWILATLFTSENVIMNAIESVLHRTGVTENSADDVFMSIGATEALGRNMVSFFNDQNLLILIAVVLVAFLYMIVKKKTCVVHGQTAIVCVLMSISPFVWIVLLTNHCSLHPHLEWRTFSVLVYAVAVFVISMFQPINVSKIGIKEYRK